MPKMKTNKAVRKRFRITKKGKILSTQSLRRHLLTDRSSKKKRSLRKWTRVYVTEEVRIKRMLPYNH